MNYLSKRRIALGAMFFFMGICFASWAARIPDIQAKFQLSEGQLGTLLLCLPIGSMLGLPSQVGRYIVTEVAVSS